MGLRWAAALVDHGAVAPLRAVCPHCRGPAARSDAWGDIVRCALHGRVLVTESAFENSDGDGLLGGLVDGRWALVERLGAGSSGVVYGALDGQGGEPAAVKVLRATGPHRDARRRRFASAQQALVRVGGAPAPRVLGSGSFPDPAVDEVGFHGASAHYVAMELVRGDSLAERLARAGPLPVVEALSFAVSVLRALAVVHHRGVIHGDLRLEHVVLGPEGRVTLLDLGAPIEDPSAVVGSPLTMAPEQVRGEPPTIASDVYAAGVVLYQLVAGRPPFQSPDAFALRRAHRVTAPPPLVAAGGEPLPEALTTLARQALAKEPAERPNGASAFADDLARMLLTYPVRVGG